MRNGIVRESLRESAEVLLREDRGGRQHERLLAVAGRLERGPQRDLGLAVADVAADQAVHRLRGLHVRLGLLDRLELVVGLAVRERALELELPLGVLLVSVALAALALRVQVDQVARHLGGRALGPRLHVVPGLGAELRERRRRAVRADVAREPIELVGRHEDPVPVAVLDLEVVARDVRDRLGVEARETAEAVIGVNHHVAGAQLRERLERAAARALRALGAAAAQQAVVRDHRGLQLRGDEPLAQACLREPQSLAETLVIVDEPRPQAREVVGGALGLAAPVPGHHRRVAGAHELLQLRLRFVDRARRGVGGLRAELVRLVRGHRGEGDVRPPLDHLADLVRREVQVVRVVGVEAGRDVLPVVGERGSQLLLGRDHDGRLVRHEVQEGAKAVDGQHLRDVGPLLGLLLGRHLRELPVLRAELRGRRDLDALRVRERSLREGREPAQRLDLVAEQLDPDRPLLGRGVDVEDAAAHGELPALEDLLLALVAARHEPRERLVEVERLPDVDGEAVRPQLGVGDPLHQGDGARDHHRRVAAVALEQRVERGDPQADEVRRRRQVGLVAHAAGRVEAHGRGRTVGAQVERKVAGHAVVAGHDEGGAAADLRRVEQRSDQERAQRGGGEGALGRFRGLAREALDVLVLGGAVKEWSQHAKRPDAEVRRPQG